MSRFQRHSLLTRPLRLLCALAVMVASLVGVAPTVTHAATFTVPCDPNALSAAITSANSTAEADTISLASGCTYTYSVAADTTTPNGATALPTIINPLTIVGNGATIERSSAPGTPEFRLFYAQYKRFGQDRGDLTLQALTLRNGIAEVGGAMYNLYGTMTLTNVTVSGNRATIYYGGGIHNEQGSLTLQNSTISGNSGGSDGGGGISNYGTLTLQNSTIRDNNAGGDGGGILNVRSTLIVKQSTLSGNSTSTYGGGIASSGWVTLQQSTISGNSASISGGGIDNAYDDSTLTVENSTISGNSAFKVGGGIKNNGPATLQNTIVANSPAGGNCDGRITDSGGNLSGDATCAFTVASSRSSVDPLLGPLANNGGPTQTHALLPGSPAMDAAVNCPPPATDQRGVARPQGSACDSGAFELDTTRPSVTINQASGQADPTSSAPVLFTATFSEDVSDFSASDVTLSGTANRIGASVAVSGGPRTYTVSVSGLTGTGTITASIAAGVATDASGNSNTASTSTDNTVTLNSDASEPVITPTISGTQGKNGWYTGDVKVTWSVVDNDSAITSQNGCDTHTVTSDTAGVTFTCTATSAGGTASQSVTIKRDATAPTITYANRTAATAGWNNSDVVVNWTCSDATSGVVNASGSQTVSSEGANGSATGTCADNAGNTASDTQTGINIDKTAPTLSPVVSPNPVLLNGSATVTSNAADALSDLASQSCGTLNTSSVGAKTVTCSATDKAGNTASATANYQVGYKWSGFFQPIDNLPTVNLVNAGRAIPVKFSLGGNQGLNIFAAGYPKSQPISCSSGAATDEVEQTVTAGASTLQYDAATDTYTYVWKTEKGWAGTCRQLIVRFVDGSEYSANFRFK
jgi:hypothetical protein